MHRSFRSLCAAAALLAACTLAAAAPTMTAAPYAAGPGQPTSAVVKVQGGADIACTLAKASDGSVTPTCDLVTLATGSYTLTMTVSNAYGCATDADGKGGSCNGGGSASSGPFAYRFQQGPAGTPTPRLLP